MKKGVSYLQSLKFPGNLHVSNTYRLGDWIITPQRNCIERGDEVIHVKPKSMAVLECLLQARGEVTTRNELFDAVWPNSLVSDATLTQCIVELRHAFSDSARHPSVIETIPKIGFRLLPEVILQPPVGKRPESENETGFEGRPRSRIRVSRPVWFVFLIACVVVLVNHQLNDPPKLREITSLHPTASSVAVLPFNDLSKMGDQAWVADGLSEALISRLAQLEGLRVTGRASSFYFKGKSAPIDEIAEHLGVDYLLEGSVNRSGEDLRINATLIEASTGLSLWSETFDRKAGDIFEIHEEITESVATALSISLQVGELGTIRGGTDNYQAYEKLMLSKSFHNQYTAEAHLKAIDLAKQAIEIDPQYVNAWLALAYLYRVGPIHASHLVSADWLQLSGEALSRARDLDPDMPGILLEDLLLSASASQWERAGELLQRLGPLESITDPDSLYYVAIFLTQVGRTADALSLINRARRLEPLAAGVSSILANTLHTRGRMNEALTEFTRAWDMEYGNKNLTSLGAMIAAMSLGDTGAMKAWTRRRIEFSNDKAEEFLLNMLRHVDEADAALDLLRHEFDSSRKFDYEIGLWAGWHGDYELAFEAMKRADTTWAFWFPLFTPVRQRSGFTEWMTDNGLLAYWREYAWPDYCEPLDDGIFTCH